MQKDALFNLKAVVRQTGVKPDTVRAWERRYGLPMPGRSSGGHRLYSSHDLETIRWLMARQREGMSIQRAVALWRQIEAEGQNPLQAATPSATLAVSLPGAGVPGETMRRYREGWLAACKVFDEQTAEQILSEAFAVYPLEAVVVGLLQQGAVEIGEGWYQDEVSVQQEHFCSSLINRRLESLILATPPPMRPGRILVACPPKEEHIIGLLVLTVLLRRRGWELAYLGADVPVERLEVTVRAINPTLVILAAQQLHTAATLLEAAQLLEAERVPTAYGGRIFNLIPELRNRIPGHFLGEGLALVPEKVEALMIALRPVPPVQVVPEAYKRARDHFRERRGLVEAQVAQALQSKGIALSFMAMITQELGRNIDAALALGDMTFLGPEIEWVQGLIAKRRIPVEELCTYLDAWYHATRDQLDEQGGSVVSWLGATVAAFDREVEV